MSSSPHVMKLWVEGKDAWLPVFVSLALDGAKFSYFGLVFANLSRYRVKWRRSRSNFAYIIRR